MNITDAHDVYRTFLEFKYPEIKDLLKQFLTLISASLIFSVTFSEKIISFHEASTRQKAFVYATWCALIAALGACGLGLYLNYLTAECAIGVIAGTTFATTFERMESMAYLFQDLAGVLFGTGFILLVISAILKRPPAVVTKPVSAPAAGMVTRPAEAGDAQVPPVTHL